jgi:hypothetical protein
MMLCYVCPTSGRKVAKFLGHRRSTDALSRNLRKLNKLRCPDCGRVHDVWDVGAWTNDAAPLKARKVIPN